MAEENSIVLEVDGQRERRSAPITAEALDLAAVSVLTAIALVGFRASYGGTGFFVVGLLGLALGIALAWLGHRLRQPVPLVLLVALVVVTALSGAIALQPASGGVLPTLDTARSLVQGFTRGWVELVTTPAPVGQQGNLFAIPYLCGFLSGILGATGALRSRRLVWAVTPPLIVLGASIVTGGLEPVALALQGCLFAALVTGWASIRARRVAGVVSTGTRKGPGRSALAVAMVAVAVAVALPLGPLLPGSSSYPRFLLATYVQPEPDPASLPSPLNVARRYVTDQKNTPLFKVTNLPAGVPLRLAVLDRYDGTTTGVAHSTESDASGMFRRVGDEIPTSVEGTPYSAVRVEVLGAEEGKDPYADYWAPTIGMLTHVAPAGEREQVLRDQFRYNRSTGTAFITGRLKAGDVLIYDGIVPSVPTEAELAGAKPDLDIAGQLEAASSTGPNANRASATDKAAVSDKAVAVAGADPAVMARVQAVEKYLTGGYYTQHGPLDGGPGHSQFRIAEFLKTPKPVGDEEQYGAAALLLTRALDIPTRLVMGFRPKAQPSGGPIAVKGGDLTVWLEVAVEGVGWVPVGDTVSPERSSKPPEKPQTINEPKTVVPPPPPSVADVERPTTSTDATADDAGDSETGDGSGLPGWVRPVALAVGIPLLLVLSFILIVTGLKRRRRRARVGQLDSSLAVTGGWSELLDVARDHGHSVRSGGTRTEVVVDLEPIAPAATTTLDRLAERADAAAFAPTRPTEAEVAGYWADVDTAAKSIRAGLPAWRRWAAALSLRSLLPERRSGRRSKG